MKKLAPQRLSVTDYLKRQIEASGRTVEELAAEVGCAGPEGISRIMDGVVKLPAGMIFPLSRALDVDPGHFLSVFLRDYMVDVEQAIHDCGLGMIVSERERTLLEAYRTSTGGTDPEVLIFQDRKVVALALI